MRKGIIFNVQKFSTNDGPGVRTTVFFKGCPLRCKWCANPESQIPGITDVPGEDGKINGEERTAEDIAAECLQDRDFYEESGGGVTISGGEAFFQPEFLSELIDILKKENIHLAIETTGYVPKEIFRELAPKFDLLLFDVKHYDSKKHRAGTGVGNELILQNLRWAIGGGINILPRIPVIPRFNADISDAEGFAGLFLELGIQRVQLLPFHNFGQNKYDILNRDYEYGKDKVLHEEDLKEYRQVFISKGIEAYF